jgi:hypothetical protein|nr:hypothetical protein [Kofleriaceae bacterium]
MTAKPLIHEVLPPFPTRAALALEGTTHRELERVFLRGSTPDLDQLVGWEFRGVNHPDWAWPLGIKKFVKGFYRDGDQVFGYNRAVRTNVLDGRWNMSWPDDDPHRYGYFLVAPVDAASPDNAALHSVLLDYARGGNKPWDPQRGLRDYLVQVDDANPHLFLGKAYYRLGPLPAVHSNFFILERHQPGLSDYARR